MIKNDILQIVVIGKLFIYWCK